VPPFVVGRGGVVADEGHAEGVWGGGFAGVVALAGTVFCEADAGVEGACAFRFGDFADVADGVVGVGEVAVVRVVRFGTARSAVAAGLAQAEDAWGRGSGLGGNVGCA